MCVQATLHARKIFEPVSPATSKANLLEASDEWELLTVTHLQIHAFTKSLGNSPISRQLSQGSGNIRQISLTSCRVESNAPSWSRASAAVETNAFFFPLVDELKGTWTPDGLQKHKHPHSWVIFPLCNLTCAGPFSQSTWHSTSYVLSKVPNQPTAISRWVVVNKIPSCRAITVSRPKPPG